MSSASSKWKLATDFVKQTQAFSKPSPISTSNAHSFSDNGNNSKASTPTNNISEKKNSMIINNDHSSPMNSPHYSNNHTLNSPSKPTTQTVTPSTSSIQGNNAVTGHFIFLLLINIVNYVNSFDLLFFLRLLFIIK